MNLLAAPPKQVPLRLNALNGASLFLISAVVIVFQIGLMRSLAIAKYHHFSYLVISIALLGFGASGTFLNATIKIAETREEAERLGLRVGDSYIEYEPAKVVKQDF